MNNDELKKKLNEFKDDPRFKEMVKGLPEFMRKDAEKILNMTEEEIDKKLKNSTDYSPAANTMREALFGAGEPYYSDELLTVKSIVSSSPDSANDAVKAAFSFSQELMKKSSELAYKASPRHVQAYMIFSAIAAAGTILSQHINFLQELPASSFSKKHVEREIDSWLAQIKGSVMRLADVSVFGGKISKDKPNS